MNIEPFSYKSNEVNSKELGNLCYQFKENNREFSNNSKIIRETVEKYTLNELKIVEESINNLNKKIEKILNHIKIKEYTEICDNLEKDMHKSLTSVISIFDKFRKQTLERKDITNNDKIKNIKSGFIKIQEALFTNEEINILKNEFNNTTLLNPRRNSNKNTRLKNK